MRRKLARISLALGALALASTATVSLAQQPAALPPGHPPVGAQAQPPPQPRQLPPQRLLRNAPPPPPPVVAAPAPDAHADSHGGGHYCPGHGPTDPPPPPNLYQGLIGVNNDLALNGNALEKLLFRYENKADECDPKNQAPPYLAQLINFTVLALIIGKFGKKPLAEGLAKRRATIMGDIDTATRLKDQAEERLNELEAQFDSIEERLETARAEYAAIAEQERARIIADAEERRARMRKDAEFRIEQELKSGRLMLLHESADNAVRAAEELLRTRLSARDHEAIAEDYLTSLATALGGEKTTTAPKQGVGIGGGA